MKNITENAKTPIQFVKEHAQWVKIFKDGAMGHQESYNKARDQRPYFEESKWVLLSEAEQEIQKLQDEQIWFLDTIKRIWKVELKENPTKDDIEWVILNFLKTSEKVEKQRDSALQILKEAPSKAFWGGFNVEFKEWLERLHVALEGEKP